MNAYNSTQKGQLTLERKKMKLLTNEQHELYENAKTCYICEKKFEDKYAKDKKYRKVRDNCLFTGKNRGTTHTECTNIYGKLLIKSSQQSHLRNSPCYSIPKEITHHNFS